MIDRLLEVASFSPNQIPRPTAWRGHLPFADWLVRELSPKLFVELGTHFGHSYFAFCQSVVENQSGTQCYAVDTWLGDDHAGEYTETVFSEVQAYNVERFANFSQLMRMTFDEAATYFSDASIDLLHIDGLHTYEAVRHDFETWFPKLAPGAVVLFHDTGVRERDFGVWKLWEELQLQYPNNIEFSHSYGLGVLQLNNVPHEKLLPWLDPNYVERQSLIRYFASLGQSQTQFFKLFMLEKEFGQLEEQVVQLKHLIQERDRQVEERDRQVEERDRQVEERDRQVEERDRQVEQLKHLIQERDGRLATLKSPLGWLAFQTNRIYQKYQRVFKKPN